MPSTTRLCLSRRGCPFSFLRVFVWPALLRAMCCSPLLMLCAQPWHRWWEKRARSTAHECRTRLVRHSRVEPAPTDVCRGPVLKWTGPQAQGVRILVLRSQTMHWTCTGTASMWGSNWPSCIFPDGKQRCTKQSQGHSVYGHSI